MQLSKVQSKFTEHMFDTVDRIQNPDADFADLFENSRIPLDEQLSIYRTHVIKTLRNVIEGSFPIVEKLTGTDFLRTMATHYVMDNPPKEACLNYYGDSFATFIESYEAAKDIAYLADCARLDWAMNLAYYAEDENCVDLSKIDPEKYGQVCFKLAHHLQLLHSSYPLNTIYEYCTESQEEPLDISARDPCHLAVVRIGEKSEIIKLTHAEYSLLGDLQKSQCLEQALEPTFEIDPSFNFEAFMQNMMALKVFTSFSYAGED